MKKVATTALIVALAVILLLLLTACSDIEDPDTRYAYINTGNGWKEFEIIGSWHYSSDNVRVTLKDGTTVRGHTSVIVISDERLYLD